MKSTYQIKKQACLLVGLVFLLSSCGEQSKKKSPRKKHQDDLQFQEAKLSDIPVLLGAKRLENEGEVDIKSGQNVLMFSSKFPQKEIVDFYEQEMERMGWQQLGSFSGKENILIFEKPYSVATVLVRENLKKKSTQINVLLSMKS